MNNSYQSAPARGRQGLKQGRGAGGEGTWPESAAARARVTGRAGSRDRAGAASCSSLPHTKPRRGENGGRG